MLTPDFLFVMGTSGKKTSLHFQKFQVIASLLTACWEHQPDGAAALTSHFALSLLLPLPTRFSHDSPSPPRPTASQSLLSLPQVQNNASQSPSPKTKQQVGVFHHQWDWLV